MDDLVKPERQLVDGHLSEPALEASAGDREDLLETDARAHLASCAACMERVALARHEHAFTADALELVLDESVLSAMVASAVDAAASEAAARATAPSRRSLATAAFFGALVAVTLGVLSLERWPSLHHLAELFQDAWALSATSDRLVSGLIPGGWGTLALALSIVLVLSLAPLRRLVSLPATRRVTTALVFLLGAVAFVPRAHALDFEGEWPVEEHLTVVVDGEPGSVALERAAAAAGLGFVGALSVDPPTHLRVRDASLRDVVVAVLGPDAPFVVERTPTLLLVRARPYAAPVAHEPLVAPPAPAIPSAPPVPPVPPVPTPPARGPVDDRIAFGGDVAVREGEVVASLVSFGGNATVEGEVMEDVVAFGGDVHVRRTAQVHGEIVSLGGEVDIEDGARASEPVSFEEAVARDEAETTPTDELSAWVQQTLASGARHALLFLFGLLLLGLAPARLDEVTRALTTVPGRAAVTGLLSGFSALVLAVVLAITIVGIPAAFVLALATAAAIYVGFVAVAVAIGRALPLELLRGSPVRQLAAGVIALFIVSGVPVIDALAAIAGIFVGLGAVVLTRGGGQPPS